MSISTETPLTSEVIRCAKCGNVLQGSLRYTGDRYCICGFLRNDNVYSQIGWVCPRCQRVNHPSRLHCECSPTTLYSFTDEH